MIDSGASTHATRDLGNLSQYSSYGGPEELTIVDGLALRITNFGSTIIPTSFKPLVLSNILHVPNLNKKLIYVSQLCKRNNIFVEFLYDCFLVKDLTTWVLLMRGHNRNNLYELQNSLKESAIQSKPMSFHCSIENKLWHKRLWHPATKTLNSMLHIFRLSNKMFPLGQECNSCQCCKSHKITFS